MQARYSLFTCTPQRFPRLSARTRNCSPLRVGTSLTCKSVLPGEAAPLGSTGRLACPTLLGNLTSMEFMDFSVLIIHQEHFMFLTQLSGGLMALENMLGLGQQQ